MFIIRPIKNKHDGTYLVPDNEILLLLHEEGIELVDLIVQQVHELRLRLPGLPIQHRRRRRDQLHKLLQILVRQELVPPARQRLPHLVLQPLPKLHLVWFSETLKLMEWELRR